MAPKIPRDLSGQDLCKLLKRFGYEIVRQSGSHIRLRANIAGLDHHLTIPDHDSLKVGTLSGILGDTAAFLKMDRKQLERELFG
jgi:predicted RNA binding protein YcfA (HicA-like mRNA interferase family)